MKNTKLSVATFALLLASGMAYAQDSTATPTQSDVTTNVNCPAPGTVPEADLKPECKPGMTTTEAPKGDSGATRTTQVPKSAAEAPAVNPPADSTASTTTNPDTTTDIGAVPAIDPAKSILATNFIGKTVYSTANENVGEINDLVMNVDGSTVVAILGVGGFLGMGEKDVALPLSDISVTRDETNTMRLTIAASKEQLEAAPVFDRTALN